ncbi:MAG: hypothetical protein ACFFED_05725 [Candidatus Thorarchaeota archaeon]
MRDQKLALLFALQEQPIAPAAKLAEEAGVTPPTARAWLEDLSKDEVYNGVQANLRVRKLGLEIDDFLVGVSSFDALKSIEKFCNEHPYTSYRARVYGGKTQGMILQFRQPDAARKHLEQALYRMKKAEMITTIRELPTLRAVYGSTYTRPRLDNWVPEKMIWDFDWQDWWSKAPNDSETPPIKKPDDERIDFDLVDTKILQEITMNARRKNVDIITAMGLDPNAKGVQQDFSTRLNRIKDELVESYRVFINWTHFDVYNTAFVIAKAQADTTRKLITHLRNSEFPFGSSIRQTPSGFVWSARLPSAHLSEMISLIWQISDSYELLMIDYKHSDVYGLWHGAFDQKTSDWRVDKDFCLDAPLKSIGL